MMLMETTYNPGDKIKVRRPRYFEKGTVVVIVREIREDGIIMGTMYHRAARGGSQIGMTTDVRPHEIVGKV